MSPEQMMLLAQANTEKPKNQPPVVKKAKKRRRAKPGRSKAEKRPAIHRGEPFMPEGSLVKLSAR